MIDDWAIVLGLELNKLFLRVRTGISMSSYLISVSCYGYLLLLPVVCCYRFFLGEGGGVSQCFRLTEYRRSLNLLET